MKIRGDVAKSGLRSVKVKAEEMNWRESMGWGWGNEP